MRKHDQAKHLLELVNFWRDAATKAEQQIMQMKTQIRSLQDSNEQIRALREHQLNKVHEVLKTNLPQDTVESLNSIFPRAGLGVIR